MDIIVLLANILQNLAISLGVGCSTLAILNFFVAIADGKIDETERNMMGIVYTVLRVAMILIFITTAIIFSNSTIVNGFSSITIYLYAQILLTYVLFANSILMTRHLMPSAIGPALQASSWYSLGLISTLAAVGLQAFTLTQFLLGYLAVFLLAVSLVNGTMAYLKSKKQSAAEAETVG